MNNSIALHLSINLSHPQLVLCTLLPQSFGFYMCYFIDDKSPNRTSSVNKTDKQFPGNMTTSVLVTL